MKKAVILARVSTEEQKEAGNSLPAQVDRLHAYVKRKAELKFDCEYIFDESAYKDNRKEFDKGYSKVDVPSNLRKTASGELEAVPEETEISEEQMRKRRNLTGFWSKFKDRIIDLFKEEEDRHL